MSLLLIVEQTLNGIQFGVFLFMISAGLTLVLGIMNVGGEKDFGRLGLKTLGFYVLTGLLAVVVGLAVVNIFQPGNVDSSILEQMQTQGEAADADKVAGAMKNADRGSKGIIEIFLRMVPTNIVAAAADGKLLGLIFFSILLKIMGYMLLRI